MVPRRNPPARWTRHHLGLAVWTLMAVCHVPGFARAWYGVLAGGSVETPPIEGCIALTLAMLFFVLKIADVRLLRFHLDRRAVVALCVGAALLHLNVLAPDAHVAIVPEGVEIVATSLMATGLSSVRRVVRAVTGAGRKGAGATSRVAPAGTTAPFGFRPHCWVLARHLFALRAPPA